MREPAGERGHRRDPLLDRATLDVVDRAGPVRRCQLRGCTTRERRERAQTDALEIVLGSDGADEHTLPGARERRRRSEVTSVLEHEAAELRGRRNEQRARFAEERFEHRTLESELDRFDLRCLFVAGRRRKDTRRAAPHREDEDEARRRRLDQSPRERREVPRVRRCPTLLR